MDLVLLKSLPSVLQSLIKTVKKRTKYYAVSGNNGSNRTAHDDYLPKKMFIPATVEIFKHGGNFYYNSSETNQNYNEGCCQTYPYYINSDVIRSLNVVNGNKVEMYTSSFDARMPVTNNSDITGRRYDTYDYSGAITMVDCVANSQYTLITKRRAGTEEHYVLPMFCI